MSDESFEKLLVWQKAQDFSVAVYAAMAECQDWDFRNQITRAANSISNNIAEGSERLTKPDYIRFLSIAKGSTGETRSQLYLAERLDYISTATANELRALSREISRMLHGLIKSLTPSTPT